jgi:hypothetical protein
MDFDTNLIQSGTPGEVYENCKSVIEKGKQIEGGFILFFWKSDIFRSNLHVLIS